MDGAYRTVRPDLGRPALTLLATVISRRGDRAIIDAGMKSLTNEFGPPMGEGNSGQSGGAYPRSMGISSARRKAVLRLSTKIEIVPSHGDTTIDLHGEYYVVRGDEVIATWPIEAARAYR